MSVETLKQMIEVDAEARRNERKRCVRLAREHALLARSGEVETALLKLAREMESPDA